MTFWDWIETTKPEGVLTAIVAATIGLATWRIAWVQKEIAKEKVISDLFDRRYEVYKLVIQTTLEIVFYRRWTSSEEIRESISNVLLQNRKTIFIFDEVVSDGFDKLTDKLFEYYRIVAEKEVNPSWQASTSPELKKITVDLGELVDSLTALVDSYMRIKDFRNGTKRNGRVIRP